MLTFALAVTVQVREAMEVAESDLLEEQQALDSTRFAVTKVCIWSLSTFSGLATYS
jgi:hypothetical protein